MTHPLHKHLSKEIDLSKEEFDIILEYFTPLSFKKKSLVITSNQYVSDQYFVLKGCLRTYLLDTSAKEHTLQFAIENWWSSDYISYYTGVKSILNVECIEDTDLLKVKKEDLEQLLLRIPKLEHFFRKQLESAFVSFQKRILSNLNNTAEERYTTFLTRYPNIEQRVKNYQIASYLGITPESLSRIRKQVK
nr:Crp/Fnr family transcriptional regulator [Aquimarina sp. AU474]